MIRSDPIISRYIHIKVQGIEYRVFYEESGKGIPIICQHAGGGDGTGWRHLLNDPELTSKFRIIVADLPYHGKSLPPESIEWWKQEYLLTKNFFMDFQIALSHALELERPVYMGCFVAGFLAMDLALEHPDEFRAVIAVGAAHHGGPATQNTFYHPSVSNHYRMCNTMYFCGPASTEKYRRAAAWCSMQSPAPVTRGDLNYYFTDHDLTDKTHIIDTKRCAVHLLTGEYDPTSSVEDTQMLADQIKGATFSSMKGLSHGGMAENPEIFKSYLMPILDKIASIGC